ncbi:uncharacterized protein ATNIH1004_010533 [Aspergillus tanneri]|uniref:Uncharacterized protein n=1 Tax=Aspergillus tanneri TaxID=1220188 RepID=A0A5M9MH02_9EURO|nr:uncharacterized protein ATNIH1004_010533 [Aspergillus tanneri]KAA8643759.1 hypothetical protein ATNIH1004_010533 [Aspergillus tanneri]
MGSLRAADGRALPARRLRALQPRTGFVKVYHKSTSNEAVKLDGTARAGDG